MIIGSFVSFNESVTRDLLKNMRIDQQVPPQLRFGEREDAHFFVLPNNSESGRYEIQFTGQSAKQALVIWFVVQIVDAKTPVDVVAEMTSRAGVHVPQDQLRNVCVRTSKCKEDCCINACRMVEDLLESG